MKTACLIWSLLAGVLIPPVMPQAPIDLGVPAYTLAVSPQPRKISVFKDNFIAMSGCQVAVSPIGSPGAKTLNKLPGTFDNQCDLYLIGEVIESTSSFLAIDGRGALSIFQMANNMQSYVRTSYIRMNYTAYYYPRVYKAELVPDTNYVFVAALQTNILFRVLVEPGGTATATRFLTNALSQSYETMAATKNNRLVLMSASGQHMELWDTTSMTFITELEFSPFVFGNIYRSVAAYPLVSQQDFIMAPKTGLVAHFIDLTNRFIVSEFPIKQENPEFCVYVPRTNYFAVLDPNNIDFLNVLDPSMSKTFAINTGLSMDTIGASFFSKSGTGYMILTYAPGGSTNGRVFDLGTHLCHVTCATCTASLDPSRCDTCQIGHSKSSFCTPTHLSQFFRESDGSPTSTCLPSEYQTTYYTCKSCSLDCESCQKYTGFCKTCSNGKVVTLDGSCAASCSPGTYVSDGKCLRCHPTCKTCTSGGQNDCLDCSTNTQLSGSGKCEPKSSCAPGFNFQWLEDRCRSCSTASSCQECTLPNLNYACLRCSASLLTTKQNCFTSCPLGTAAAEPSTCTVCEESPSPLSVHHEGKCIARTDCPTGSYNETTLVCSRPSTKETGLGTATNSVVLAINLSVVGVILLVICAIFWTCHFKQRRLQREAQTLAAIERSDEPVIVEVHIGDRRAQPAAAIVQDTEIVPLRETTVKQSQPDNELVQVFSLSGVKNDGIPVLIEKEVFVLAIANPTKFMIDPAVILPHNPQAEVEYSLQQVDVQIVSQIEIPKIPEEYESRNV